MSWIDAFLHHLRLERGRAENTIRAYSHDLAKFAAFAAEHDAGADPGAEEELNALRPEVISAFMVALGQEGLSATMKAA